MRKELRGSYSGQTLDSTRMMVKVVSVERLSPKGPEGNTENAEANKPRFEFAECWQKAVTPTPGRSPSVLRPKCCKPR